jgi:hypothetical protein
MRCERYGGACDGGAAHNLNHRIAIGVFDRRQERAWPGECRNRSRYVLTPTIIETRNVVTDSISWKLAAVRRGAIGLGYSFDERVFRQVFVVLSYDCFGLLERRKPPLYFQIFVSSDAFDNSALFYKQFEFIWLIGVCGVAVKAGCKIDAPGSDPIALHHALAG